MIGMKTHSVIRICCKHITIPNKAVKYGNVLKIFTRNSARLESPLKKKGSQGYTYHKENYDRTNFSENGYILLTIPVLTFGLGVWQIERRKQKLQMIKMLQENTNAEVIPFPVNNLASVEDLEYRPVKITGTFDHSQELYVMPRAPQDQIPGMGSIITTQPKIGAYVITAFKVKGSNVRVLVNRGWVSREKLDPRTREEGQVQGEVEFTAIVRKPEKKPLSVMPQSRVDLNQWLSKDSIAMSKVLRTTPIMLDADTASTVPGGPLGGQTKVNLRNEHVSYILTWFGLSSVTFFLWHRHYWRRIALF